MAESVIYPDKRLLQVCKDCEVGDKSLVRLAKEMAKQMYDNLGVGIAAPQIGDDRRIIVVDCSYDIENKNTRDPLILVNPKIVETKGESKIGEEGCLSCPGISVPISRPPWVKVRYFDLDGAEWEIEADELLGRCLQHEIDHLDGKTLFESCSGTARLKAIADFELAKKAGARPGETSI